MGLKGLIIADFGGIFEIFRICTVAKIRACELRVAMVKCEKRVVAMFL